MSDEQQPPRIVERDRRRFTPEGKPRRASSADAAAPEVPAEVPADRAAPETAGSAPPPAQPPPDSSPERPPAVPASPETTGATPGSRPPESDPRLQQLVFLLLHHADLVVQAAEAAAAEPDGSAAAEGTPPPAASPEVLEGLQSVIGILEMLEEKTGPRLAADDSRMLSRVLYQMRMDYIGRVGPPGSPDAAGAA